MEVHEFQAKEILARFGAEVPRGRECTSAEEAERAHEELGCALTVVKAQIHAGGRGAAGGVRLVHSPEEARAAATDLLGSSLVTHQTGPAGQEIQRLWVEEGSDIASEYYLGIALDRELARPVLMASSEGGVQIEEVAAATPEKIHRTPLAAGGGLAPGESLRLVRAIGIPADLEGRAIEFVDALVRAYTELDCSLAEINPLVTTTDGSVRALDAKLVFDSNALFRHPDILEYRDLAEEDEKEIEASRHSLSYIALDGNIGCMVNGAGLAMATMDLIKLNGGEPANFLDVGGGATVEAVTSAFRILLSDSKVKGVLVNIFGGIMRCDVIAEGICEAARTVSLNVPLVVRLEGTNVEAGRAILAASGLALETASDLDEAAGRICAAVAARGES